jgi:class I fructose-bisphosphate aldolase
MRDAPRPRGNRLPYLSRLGKCAHQEPRVRTEEAKASRAAVTTRWYARGSSMIQKAKPSALCPPHRGAVGAHILKVKLPTDHSKQAQAKRAHDTVVVPTGTLTEWAPPTFGGHRIVIVSDGATKEKNESAFDEAHAIRDGGGLASIIGGNSFQRPREHGLPFLETITEI